MDDFAVYCLAVNVDLLDSLRMDIRLDLSFYGFEHDLESCDLDTAAGGTCTGAEDHETQEQELGNRRPEVKVRCGKTCRCNDGCHLEEGMS